MHISVFRHELRIRQGVRIRRDLILFKSNNLYNLDTDEMREFKTLDEAMAARVPGGVTVSELIETLTMDDLKLVLDGGRGSSSSEGRTFKFGHAGGGKGTSNPDLPAKVNVKVSNAEKNPDAALKAFRALHGLDKTESAVTVNEQGFITQYVHGDRTSVGIAGKRGELVYHNHPSGGAFSDSDLISTATSSERGIVASGKNGDYILVKASHFKAEAFVRAVKNARIKGKNYDDAVNKWLKANQSKYGYKYEFRKA